MRTPSQYDNSRAASFGMSWQIVLLAIYVFTRMFYVLHSGSIQPADILLILLALTNLGPISAVIADKRSRPVVVLSLWILIVDLAWFVTQGDLEFLRYAVYYMFNTVVFILFFVYFKSAPKALSRHLRWAVALSFVVQLAILFIERGHLRAAGSFNNPNQLGYWCILLIAIYGMASHDRQLTWKDFAVVGLGIYIALHSVSRAALAGVLLSLAILLFVHDVSRQIRYGVIAAGVLVFALFVAIGGMRSFAEIQVVQNFETRYEALANRQSGEQAYRGWDRIWKFPEYTFLGAGEGGYDRFEETDQLELHSSFGTIFFAYGIVGLIMFIYMIYQCFRGAPKIIMYHMVPVLSYGLTHQGLRFSWFWIVLAMIAGFGAAREPKLKTAMLNGPRTVSVVPRRVSQTRGG